MRSIWLSKVFFIAGMLAWMAPAGMAQKSANTGPKYDLANEVKIKGVVDEVRALPGEPGGTRLLVKTDSNTVVVQLAPGEFLKEIDTSFAKGDLVQIVGAKAQGSADGEILAREITVGVNIFTLRDQKGIPVWSGWKPAKAMGK